MFQPVDKKMSFPEMEKRILKFWEENQIFEKSLEQNNKKEFVFYDGPPFATGLPHYGHLLAGTLKDIVPRFWTMKGYRVDRRFGWDCHGLPIENEVEKQLNISGRPEIEAFGVPKFNETCRSIVLRYTAEWEKTVTRMGRWVDFKNDYKTMDLDYMESIWWVFKTIWDQNLIYEGYRVQPICPRCGTPLSNFEVNLGPQEKDNSGKTGHKKLQDPSLTIRFKVKSEDAYFYAWTTTPWTLPSNLALAVGPEMDYVKVKTKDEVAYLAKGRLSAYFKEEKQYQILAEKKGHDLAGMSYEPLFPYFRKEPNAFRVLTADYVTLEDGTGIVHQAPAFGEDDYLTCQKAGIGLVNPIDMQGCFTPEVPEFTGRFCKEADKDIIKMLKDQKKVVKHETLDHPYPHCYRCETPLIYKAISTWFMKLDPIKEKLIANNQTIHWVPETIKDGRFGNWLKNARDWNLSRNRYWGNPIPVWKCSNPKCEELCCLGSRKDLEERSGKKVTDLHKHFIDEYKFPCKKCKSEMLRVPEVLDCWFESGAMPYAQCHYPFENKTQFEKNFPADFIAEGLDQTRGWFYTLLVLSTALFQKPAFKNVIVNGLILAKDGKKMSKRLKNYPDPEFILNKYGADALRAYLINSPVVRADDLRFNEENLELVLRSVIIQLFNSYSFFVTYATVDQFKPDSKKPRSDQDIDKWILSKLHHLIQEVDDQMCQYNLYKVVPALEDFIENLNNWYIQRSRRRFWKAGNDEDKEKAYLTLYEILTSFCQVLAPFLPFICEEIYQNLVRSVNQQAKKSIHLCPFPKADTSVIHEDVLRYMDSIQKVVALGRSLSKQQKRKIRMPIASLTIVVADPKARDYVQKMSYLISEALNVKEIKIIADESELVHISAKPNFRVLGKRFGKQMGDAQKIINTWTYDQIQKIQKGESLEVLGQSVTKEDIDIVRKEKEGLTVMTEEGVTIAMDFKITPELESEGNANELVRSIQAERKEMDLDVLDKIQIRLFAPEKLQTDFKAFQEYIFNETQTRQLEYSLKIEAKSKASVRSWDINGTEVLAEITKI